jgi:hypothetical protein
LSSTFDELADSSAVVDQAINIPALHVILTLPLDSNKAAAAVAPAQDFTEVRTELVDYLAAALGGDVEAAEWTLLALFARM